MRYGEGGCGEGDEYACVARRVIGLLQAAVAAATAAVLGRVRGATASHDGQKISLAGVRVLYLRAVALSSILLSLAQNSGGSFTLQN